MNPVVLRKRIDIDALIRKEAISKKQRDESKQFPYKLVVKEIHWKDKNRVDIRPYYREDWLDETIELSVPQRQHG